MKNILISGIVLSMIFSLAAFSQNIEQNAPKSMKKEQNKLFNDVSIAYGLGSLYLFTGDVNHSYNYEDYYPNGYSSDIRSIGAFSIGYNRMVSRVVMIGFVASYINVNYSKAIGGYEGGYQTTATYNDNLLNGIARVTFNYVNKPTVRVYSGAGMGITVDLSNVTAPGMNKETERKILPAGQLTFMGVRFGRSFGGFVEFGIGTNAIISGGLNYQFGD